MNKSMFVFSLFLISCGRQKNKELFSYNIVGSDSIKIVSEGDRILSEGVIKNNDYNGLFKSYYPGGKVHEQGAMTNGRRIGLWKQFNEQGALTEAKSFYDDKVVCYLDKDDLDFRKIRLQRDSLEIEIPKYWNNEDVNGTSNVLLVIRKVINGAQFNPNLNVTQVSANGLTISSMVNFLKKRILTDYEDASIVFENAGVIDSTNAYEIGFKMTIEKTDVGAVVVCFLKKDKCYMITGMAMNDDKIGILKYKGVFEQVAASARVY